MKQGSNVINALNTASNIIQQRTNNKREDAQSYVAEEASHSAL